MKKIQLNYNDLENLEDLIELVTKAIADAQRPPKEVVLKEKDVLTQLGISKRTLASWRAQGVIQFTQVKKVIVYTLADVLDVVNKHRVVSVKSNLRIAK